MTVQTAEMSERMPVDTFHALSPLSCLFYFGSTYTMSFCWR